MLDKNPESRATIQELRENEWINEGKTSLVEEEYTIKGLMLII